MRILFFARKKQRTRTSADIVEALREIGHEVRFISYGKWRRLLGEKVADMVLRRVARAFKTDLVFVWKECISVPLLTDLARSCKSVLFCAAWFSEPPEQLRRRACLTDMFLLTNTGQLEAYAGAGFNRPVFWPQACDVDAYRPVDSVPDSLHSEVAFIGAPNRPRRQELLQAVDREFDLKIWGRGWNKLAGHYKGVQRREVLPHQYPVICAGAKVMLGCDATTETEHYFSNRTWLTLGCRGFLLTNYSPGLEDLFENHRHIVWYRSADECIDLLRYYLPRDDDRLRIAHAGCELVRAKHTYVHRARELIKLVNELPPKEVHEAHQR